MQKIFPLRALCPPGWPAVAGHDKLFCKFFRLGRYASVEGLFQLRGVEITADEDHARSARLACAPFALEIAFEDHVHGLEDEALGIVLDVDDALGTQDVGPLFGDELGQPARDLAAVPWLVRS